MDDITQEFAKEFRSFDESDHKYRSSQDEVDFGTYENPAPREQERPKETKEKTPSLSGMFHSRPEWQERPAEGSFPMPKFGMPEMPKMFGEQAAMGEKEVMSERKHYSRGSI